MGHSCNVYALTVARWKADGQLSISGKWKSVEVGILFEGGWSL